MRRATAKATVRALENEVFCRWGYPSAIISDNGTQFTSEEFRRACRRWKTRHWPTALYHPQANPAERRNQELKKLMRILTQEPTPKPWDETIPKGLFNLRKRRNAATGQSPSELLLGFEITRPGQWDMNNQAVQTTTEERQQLAEENLARYRRRYDERDHQPPTYEIGDQVLVRRHTPLGLRSRWIGPLSITGITGENCYKVDRGTSETIEHVDNIRPAPKIQRHRQRGVGTQVEPGDEHPIQVTVVTSTKATKPNSTTLHCTAFAPGSRNDARRGAVDRKHPRRNLTHLPNPGRQLPNQGQNHRPTQREALGERRDNDTQTDGGRRQDIRATTSNNLGQQLPRQIGGDAEETRKGTTRTNCVDRDQNRASKRGERDTALREFSPDFVNIVHKCK
jgi:hypothetical protein